MIPVVTLEAAAELAGQIARVPFVAGELDAELFGEGLALRLVPLASPRRRSALAAAAYAVADLLAASRAGITSVQVLG